MLNRVQARRELRELRIRREMDGGGAGEPKSPTSASVATSVVVQVGESLSNLRLSDDSASVQQRGSQKSRPPPAAAFRVKVRSIIPRQASGLSCRVERHPLRHC